jgi:hypothetical protein
VIGATARHQIYFGSRDAGVRDLSIFTGCVGDRGPDPTQRTLRACTAAPSDGLARLATNSKANDEIDTTLELYKRLRGLASRAPADQFRDDNRKETIMGIKPTIDLTTYELPGVGRIQFASPQNNLPVPTPREKTSLAAPAPFEKPRTVWGTMRATKYHRAQAELSKAQSGYLRAQTELAKSLVAAARVASELAELSEICDGDVEIRRLNRERDFLAARTELEQARHGLYATQDEVDKLRKPRTKKPQRSNAAAIDALIRTKVDMEILGEDTREIDETLAVLQNS